MALAAVGGVSKWLIWRVLGSARITGLVHSPSYHSVPFFHRFVGFFGKHPLGYGFGEDATIWSRNIIVSDSLLDEGYMFPRAEQKLECLPSHEARGRERGDGRGFKRIGGGLQGMKTAHRLVYERQRPVL